MKVFLKYFKVFVLLIGIYVVFSVLSCFIPNKIIHKNIERSVVKLEREGDYPFVVNSQKEYRLDNFTDAMIINQIYSIDNSHPFTSFIFVKHQITPKMSKVQALAWRVKHPKEPNSIYPRYWHGNTFVTRLLFLIGDFSKIRWILYAVSSMLFIVFCVVLYKKSNLINTIAAASGLLFVNFFVTQFSIQFSPVIVLSLLSSILLCYNIRNEKRIPMIFFIFGSLTAYMDLLTTPLLTLGIPLMVYFLLTKDAIENESLKKSIQTLIIIAFLWVLGYGFTWITKWLIATVFTDMNVFKDAWEATTYRLQSEANQRKPFTRFDAIGLNAKMLPWVYINAILSVLLLMASCFFRKKGIKSALIFIVIAMIPYLWFYVVANHSFLHWWFVYRVQAISVSCLFLAFLSLISWDKWIGFFTKLRHNRR